MTGQPAGRASVAALIAADKATTEAATEGPWGYGGSGVSTFYTEPTADGRWRYREDAPHRVICQTDLCSTRAMRDGEPDWLAGMKQDAANGKFIAAARSRWPVYIAAIEAVLTTCDELEDIVDDEGIFSAATIQIRAALAAVLAPSTEETK